MCLAPSGPQLEQGELNYELLSSVHDWRDNLGYSSTNQFNSSRQWRSSFASGRACSLQTSDVDGFAGSHGAVLDGVGSVTVGTAVGASVSSEHGTCHPACGILEVVRQVDHLRFAVVSAKHANYPAFAVLLAPGQEGQQAFLGQDLAILSPALSQTETQPQHLSSGWPGLLQDAIQVVKIGLDTIEPKFLFKGICNTAVIGVAGVETTSGLSHEQSLHFLCQTRVLRERLMYDPGQSTAQDVFPGEGLPCRACAPSRAAAGR